MDITGKIIFALPEMTGTSKAGNPWKKKEYVLETQDSIRRKVHFDFFGDRADQFPLNVGDLVKLSFDIESREYNGRWFTSIRGWKAEKIDQAAGQMSSSPYPGVTEPPIPQSPAAFASDDPTDNLPF